MEVTLRFEQMQNTQAFLDVTHNEGIKSVDRFKLS